MKKFQGFKKLTYCTATAALLLSMSSGNVCSAAGVIPPWIGDLRISDPISDLNRTGEQLERERLARELAENAGKKPVQVEDDTDKGDTQEMPAVTFKLNNIVTDSSTVLTDEEINGITAEYIGKEVTVDELYTIVEKINTLYDEKGYVTCRAFLKAQTIKDGIVHITLIEGQTGEITVAGNKSTEERYILDRVHLQKGQVADTNQLNKDLLRFNATNDVQLRIVMKAGAEVGTTDFALEAYEPKLHSFSLLVDNMGNKASGEWRQGLFYTDKSLSGVRDALTLGFIRSTGMKAFSMNYSYPVNKLGTKLNLSLSGNNVDSSFNTYNTDGKALSFSIGLVHPALITERTRSEYTFDYIRQTSTSDINVNNLTFNLVDDVLNDVVFGFNMTKYGDSGVWYQKNNLTWGRCSSDPSFGLSTSQSYVIYRHTEYFQKRVNDNGDVYTLKGDWQHSFKKDLRSSRQFNIGGAYTVRGYKENYMGADSGIVLTAEYQTPISERKDVNAFAFFDYGRLYGENGESNDVDNTLYSCGLGVKATIDKNINASLTLGIPLKKNFPGKNEDVSGSRINFLLTGTF